MKYPKEYLDEIKLRLKVSQVVGKHVKLKKRGKEFIGLSPFSSEKTPSFTVNDEKGFYHCFSSGEHRKCRFDTEFPAERASAFYLAHSKYSVLRIR